MLGSTVGQDESRGDRGAKDGAAAGFCEGGVLSEEGREPVYVYGRREVYRYLQASFSVMGPLLWISLRFAR